MKNLTSKSFKFIPAALGLALALLANNAKGQIITNYWNGPNDPTPTGNWEDQSWTTDPTGMSADSYWQEGSVPVFSAGSGATGSYTITAANNHTNAGMVVLPGCGAVTIVGPGVLSITNGVQLFAATNLTINAVLAGVDGTCGFQSAGGNNIYLNGANTFSGGVNLNGGNTYITNGNALGTGAITPIYGGVSSPLFSALYFNGGAPITLANNFTINTAFAGIIMPISANTPVALNGSWTLTQDLYLRIAPVGGDPSTNVYINGAISGANKVFFSANNTKSYFVLNTNNTYTGKTTIGNGGGNATFLTVTNFNSFNGGTPPLTSSSLGYPTVDPVIDVGNVTPGNACGFDYFGPGETTDRSFNNINTPSGGMWFYADGTGPLVISGNITAVNSASSRTLTIQGSSTAQNTISGIIANGTSGGTIAVTKDGTGTWALTGNNTFSGAVTVNRGLLLLGGQNYSSTANWSMNQFSDCASTIKIIADNPLPYPSHGTAAVVMNGTVAGVQITTLDLNGHWVNCNSLNMGNTSSDVNCVLDNASSSAATLEMTCTAGKTWYGVVKNTGGGDLTVIHRANQNFTIMNHCPNWTGGGLVLTNGCGTFWCDYYDELPNPSSPRVVVTLANAPTGCFRDNQHGSISFTANQQFYIGANNGAIKSGYANGNVVTIAGKITGPGKLIVQGDGKTTAEVLISNTANDWAGGLDIGNNGGTGAILALGNSGVIPHGSSAGNVTLYGGNSGKLDLNGNNATINGLTTSGTAANTAIDNSAASTASVLSVGDNNATGFTFGGIIKNTGSGATLGLTKIGSGTLTLTGANTYSGTTTISSGTLAIGSGGAVGSGTVAVGAGAAFDVSAVGVTLGGSQTLQAGGTGGSSSAIATASGKNLTLGATSPLQFTAYDGSTVPLTVTGAGSLGIATANAVTVTPTTQLAAGSYKLVQIGIGNTTAVSLTGSAPSVTISPPGMVTGGTASLRVTSGELWLDICVHSADPTSASASPSTINTGGSSTLTLSGGGGGTSQTIQWYTGSCGGTAVGSGNSLSVSPTATTTYYGRYEDGAPCSYNSACASATVTVVSLSPVTITNINTSSINYTGGSGSQFVLLGTNNVTAPLTNWTRLYTNPATPGSFTITPSNPEFYRIKSE